MNDKIKQKLKSISTNKLLDLSCLIAMEIKKRDGEERDNIQESLDMLDRLEDELDEAEW